MANKQMGVITVRNELANQSLGFIKKPSADGSLQLTTDHQSAGRWEEGAAQSVMDACRCQLWQAKHPSARVISFKFKKGY